MRLLKFLDLERPNVQFKRDASWVGPAITATDNLFSRIENNLQNRRNRNMTREMWDKQVDFGREQMAAQRKMFDDEIAENRFLQQQARNWQLEDTESERKWNSAQAVAQRFRDAGINPYLAMVEGAAGQFAGSGYNQPSFNSSSSPSGSISGGSAPSGQVNVNQPFRGEGLGLAVSQWLQAQKQNADISRDRIQLMQDGALILKQIESMDIDNNYKSALKSQVLQELFEKTDTYGIRKEGMKIANDAAWQTIVESQARIDKMEFDEWLQSQYLQMKREMQPYEIDYIRSSANKLWTEATEMVKNGASERELKNWLIKEKQDQIRDFEQNIEPQHAAESMASEQRASLEEERTRRVRRARQKRVFRMMDDTLNYIGNKLNSIIKLK